MLRANNKNIGTIFLMQLFIFKRLHKERKKKQNFSTVIEHHNF